MHILKGYVHNKSWPKGSIAEGYVMDECLTFCSQNLHGIETKFNCPKWIYYEDSFSRNNSSLKSFCALGQPLGKVNIQELRIELLNATIIYILQNCKDVESFIRHSNSIFV